MKYKKAKELIRKYTFSNSFDLFPDFEKSYGSYLVDAQSEIEYLDLCSFYASRPIAFNHKKLQENNYQKQLQIVTNMKVPVKDYFSIVYAEFVEQFMEFLPNELQNKIFCIDSG